MLVRVQDEVQRGTPPTSCPMWAEYSATKAALLARAALTGQVRYCRVASLRAVHLQSWELLVYKTITATHHEREVDVTVNIKLLTAQNMKYNGSGIQVGRWTRVVARILAPRIVDDQISDLQLLKSLSLQFFKVLNKIYTGIIIFKIITVVSGAKRSIRISTRLLS